MTGTADQRRGRIAALDIARTVALIGMAIYHFTYDLEMFGHLALLRRAPRRGQATAITHCTLLTLDDSRFLTLLRDDEGLRAAVKESAAKRGLSLDQETLDAL